MKIILLFCLIFIIVIVYLNVKKSKNDNPVPVPTPIPLLLSTPRPTLPQTSNVSKDDKERKIIIIIKNNNKTSEIKIDTEFLTQIFDNLINLIQRLVKKLMSDGNKKLTSDEVNELLPKFISSAVDNMMKMILFAIFENPELRDINEIKSKLITLLQDNFITDFVLKNNDLESSTKIIKNSTEILNKEIDKNLNNIDKSIEDAKNFIPNMLSNIVFDMSKGIINNVVTFDENGNVINSKNLNNIKNEFINVLNKYLPYKVVYFETSNNGSTNMPGITIKLDQLNQNERVEPLVLPHEINIFDKPLNIENIYQKITNLKQDESNKSFNIQDMKDNNIKINSPYSEDPSFSIPFMDMRDQSVNDELNNKDKKNIISSLKIGVDEPEKLLQYLKMTDMEKPMTSQELSKLPISYAEPPIMPIKPMHMTNMEMPISYAEPPIMPIKPMHMTNMEMPISYAEPPIMPIKPMYMTNMEMPIKPMYMTNMEMPIKPIHMTNMDNQPLPINLSHTKQQMNISVKPNELAKNINDLRYITPKELENKMEMSMPIKFNIQGMSDVGKPIQNNSNTAAKGVFSRKPNVGKNICRQ